MMRTVLTAAAIVGALFPSVLLADAPVASVEQIHASGPPMVLTRGGGVIVHLPKGARMVAVADPEVANVQLGSSPTSFFLYGKSGGDTVLYVEGDEDEVLLKKIVHVRPLDVKVLRGKENGK